MSSALLEMLLGTRHARLRLGLQQHMKIDDMEECGDTDGNAVKEEVRSRRGSRTRSRYNAAVRRLKSPNSS